MNFLHFFSLESLNAFQERSLPGLHNPADRLGLINYEKIERKVRAAFKPYKISPGPRLPQLASGRLHPRDSEKSLKASRIKLPEIGKNTKVCQKLVQSDPLNSSLKYAIL